MKLHFHAPIFASVLLGPSLFGLSSLLECQSAHAQSAGRKEALVGKVTLPSGEAAEGVVVSAKLDGSPITISVVSNEQGVYSFPAARIPPGRYELRIRAVGYDLSDATFSDVAAHHVAHRDLKLQAVKAIEPQLTNTEWLMSAPGTEREKSTTLLCVDCHTYQRIFMSTFKADEFASVVERMGGYSSGSTPERPLPRVEVLTGHPERFQGIARYLSTINLSSGPTRSYPLQTLPRPTGRSTRAVITEYQLPRSEALPHDVVTDRKGVAWYVDFGSQFLGKFDAKTGAVTEYEVPTTKPGFPPGLLDIEFDRDENPWMGMKEQAEIAKFDRQRQAFTTYPMPDDELKANNIQIGMVEPRHAYVDGYVWMGVNARSGFDGIQRLNLRTGKFERFDVYQDIRRGAGEAATGGEGEPPGRSAELPGRNAYYGVAHGTYGIATDSGNNLYFADFADAAHSLVGRVDAQTAKLRWYELPTHFARPRRLFMDSRDQLWIAEFRANKIAVLETKTGKIREWDVPAGTYPYHVVADRSGDAWTGSVFNDRIVRVNTRTGEATAYLLPHGTNIRRMFVDDSTTPVTVWVGSNHGRSIVKLEPLD